MMVTLWANQRKVFTVSLDFSELFLILMCSVRRGRLGGSQLTCRIFLLTRKYGRLWLPIFLLFGYGRMGAIQNVCWIGLILQVTSFTSMRQMSTNTLRPLSTRPASSPSTAKFAGKRPQIRATWRNTCWSYMPNQPIFHAHTATKHSPIDTISDITSNVAAETQN